LEAVERDAQQRDGKPEGPFGESRLKELDMFAGRYRERGDQSCENATIKLFVISLVISFCGCITARLGGKNVALFGG
jgi:hypothetical protein